MLLTLGSKESKLPWTSAHTGQKDNQQKHEIAPAGEDMELR